MGSSLALRTSTSVVVWKQAFAPHQQKQGNLGPSYCDVANHGARSRGGANYGWNSQETLLTLQLSRRMGAWQPSAATHQHKHEVGGFAPGKLGPWRGCVSNCRWKDGAQRTRISPPNGSSRARYGTSRLVIMHCSRNSNAGNDQGSGCSIPYCSSKGLQGRGRVTIMPCSSNSGVKAKSKRESPRFAAVNRARGGSSSREASATLEEELKDQLEAWQEEALHVRDRYNNARARFMRLTEVVQQLRQRAAIDMEHGNEDEARKVLAEKQKVMRAAELSKKRAQLLEELSTKLGEAISRKETELIVALSNPPPKDISNEETPPRIVPAKGDPMMSFGLDQDREENPTASEIPGSLWIASEVPDAREQSKTVSVDRGDVLAVKENESGNRATEQVYPTHGDLYAKDKELEAAGMRGNSNSEDLQLETREKVGGKDFDLQSGRSLPAESYLQEAAFTSGLDTGGEKLSLNSVITGVPPDIPDLDAVNNFKTGSAENEEMAGAVTDTDLDNGNRPANFEGSSQDIDTRNEDGLCLGKAVEGATGEVNFYDGGRLLFEDFLLDVDHKVAAVESKLRIFVVTAVSSNEDMCDKRLQLVGKLLEEVQILRARIAKAVSERSQQD